MRLRALAASALLLACDRGAPGPVAAASSHPMRPALSASPAPVAPPATTDPASSARPAAHPEPRILRFVWGPPGAPRGAYSMKDPEDQHRVVMTPGVSRGGRYPLVIAFHGQPRPGQPPREYDFLRTVTEVTLGLVERGEVAPLLLALPVFRFQGANWPGFELLPFSAELARVLDGEGITISRTLVLGHSGAAGCGGGGLNQAHRLNPAAVGFFDTCIGPGFGLEVRALLDARVPTLIVHSVETAGFRPRQSAEYLSTFDFGKVYAPLGLRPNEDCPAFDAPLRDQPYRCASDPTGTVRAFVIDTGEGQAAHDAVVPLALGHFLRQFAAR